MSDGPALRRGPIVAGRLTDPFPQKARYCVICDKRYPAQPFVSHEGSQSHHLIASGLMEAAITIRDRQDWRARLARWLLFRAGR